MKNSKPATQSRWLCASMLHAKASFKENIILTLFYVFDIFQQDLQAKLQLRYGEIAKR